MPDELEKDTSELIKQFNNVENKKAVDNVQITNPIQDLGLNIIDFFKKRLIHINKIESFKDKVRMAIEKKIESDTSKVTFSELSNLFIRLTEQNSLASDQIISLLKPPQSSSINPFTSSAKKESESYGSDIYDPDTQKKVDVINRLIEAAANEALEKESDSSNKPSES